MGIYFRCSNALMAKHFLDGPKVGTTFYQMGRKRVSKAMGGDGFFDPCF